MSHVVIREALERAVSDLGCLRRALARCSGLELRENQRTFRNYTGNGKCVHAIRLTGAAQETCRQVGKSHAEFEIGLVPSEKTPGAFAFAYDPWGGAIDHFAGTGLDGLQQHYQVEVLKQTAVRQGDMVIEVQQEDGSIVLEVDSSTRMGG